VPFNPARARQRWLERRWVVLAVGRPEDEVSNVKLRRDLPVSVRSNIDA